MFIILQLYELHRRVEKENKRFLFEKPSILLHLAHDSINRISCILYHFITMNI